MANNFKTCPLRHLCTEKRSRSGGTSLLLRPLVLDTNRYFQVYRHETD
jgi:hypothetical protein